MRKTSENGKKKEKRGKKKEKENENEIFIQLRNILVSIKSNNVDLW